MFSQFGAPLTYSAGTGLTESPAYTFNIANTGVVSGSYGGAATAMTLSINAQGQITSATDVSIAINGNQITSGTVGSAYISGSYTGITGVGTLTSGTWNATTMGVAYGGTGLTSYAVGDLIYASGTTTLSKLADVATGNALISGGVGVAPSYGKIGLTTHITGTLAVGNGGTGLATLTGSNRALYSTSSSTLTAGTLPAAAGGTGNSSYTAGDIPYASATTTISKLAIGTVGTVLTSTGTAPSWAAQSTLAVGTATNLAGGAASQVPYQTGAGATAFVANGTAGQVFKSNGASAPTWGNIDGGTF